MVRLLDLLLVLIIELFRSRRDLVLEYLAHRQQFAVFSRRRLQPRFPPSDWLFWVMFKRFWRLWKHAFIPVEPETVMRWHRAGATAPVDPSESGSQKCWAERLYECFRETGYINPTSKAKISPIGPF